MRYLLLALAASSLALTGCGKKETTGNTSAVDEAVTAEDFASNDVTAIDAATGAAANMAADVDLNFVSNTGDDPAGVAATARSRPRTPTAPSANTASNAAEPADEPATPPPAPPAETNAN